jgi:hypothetical protein
VDKKSEIRKLPKKTIVYMIILVILAVGAMFLVQNGRAIKASVALHKLGFTNISNIVVFSRSEFTNKDTKINGFKYSLKFKDLSSNKQCQGFVLQDFKGNTAKDLDCK